MIDFISYVVQELKAKRLNKDSALALVQQFSKNGQGAKALHPLLGVNTSDLTLQSYTSRFDGEEFFLNDHRIGQGESAQKVLPGVAYLEMATQAIRQALPYATGAVKLSDVVWLAPIVVSEPTTVIIALYPLDDSDTVEFEIYSVSQDEQTLHCQGVAGFTEAQLLSPLNVAAIKAGLNQGRLESAKVYPAYRQMGVQFGPAHQGLVAVNQGRDGLLAELKLPEALKGDFAQFELHPTLLDSALQGAIGFYGDLSALPSEPSVPFALSELCVYRRCPVQAVAYIRHAQGSSATDNVSKLDIDLCDGEGNICVSFKGFTSRKLSAAPLANAPVGTLVMAPFWQSDYRQNYREQSEHQQQTNIEPEFQLTLALGKKPLEQATAITTDSYEGAAKQCVKAVNDFLKQKGQRAGLINLIVPHQGPWLGLSGLLKTCALEIPSVSIKVLQSDDEGSALLAQLAACPVGSVIREKDGKLELLQWQGCEQSFDGAVFKEQGVYLITGGLGGLGVIFAKTILANCPSAKVIVTGRSAPNALGDKQALLASLTGAEYRQLNLTDEQAVTQLITELTAQYGSLNGVLHSAGMNDDSFIINKTDEQIDKVFAPKVSAARYLDSATAALDLDFFVLFSSGAAVLGNVGQADYAMANGYLDQFAIARQAKVNQGERSGQSLSINWPLWLEGGMQVDAATGERMYAATGMQPMTTENGIKAFYQALVSGQPQVLVMQGDKKRLKQVLNGVTVTSEPVPMEPVQTESSAPAINHDAGVAAGSVVNLEEQTELFLRKELSGLLKMPAAKIDPAAQLERYGIDSILTMDLTNKLEKTFGSLSKTLFFEYQTILELTGYFIAHHKAVLEGLFVDTQVAQPQAQPVTGSAAVPVNVQAPAQTTAKAPNMRRLGKRFARSEQTEQAQKPKNAEPIAIVGLSGRYPQGWDIEAYWQNLKQGKDCVTEVPPSRWDWQEYYSEDRNEPGCHYSKWGGFIDGVDEFDPLFFGIVPVGAEYLDPQERLFLQHAWMAIEDAGFTRAAMQIPHEGDLPGQVGVYAGVMYGEYQLFGAQLSQLGNRLGFAGNPASIANRVSYVMNLHGPSMTVDTMCSSSLTAIHLACEDLASQRTDLALAGGVNVSVHPNKYLMISAGQFISSEGQCQSFGEGGDGYIPAEGVGVVVLQRLSDAKAGGQHIYGLIRGSALSHGGKTNGYTVPNPQAQTSAIKRAMQAAKVNPRHISYIEAHGTGTKLGDPIEIAALSNAFAQQESGYCRIGSAKSNVGHCEAAAGIAGLTKVLLQMRHEQIAPSLHSAKLNPHIDFGKTPFVVNQHLVDWQRPVIDGQTLPRIAGISSFGAGGSNAHLIVEEYRQTVSPVQAQGPVAIVLSARTAEQLRRKASELNAFVKAQQPNLASVAYTLQLGREAMDERLALLATSLDELSHKLSAFLAGDTITDELYVGEVKLSKDEMSLLNADEDMKAAIDKWVSSKKLGKLLELWVKGLSLDWHKFYQEQTPGFISLPSYPFARDRYWIDQEQLTQNLLGAQGKLSAVLHPLLHSNTSDLTQQSYSTQLTGNETFLRDHQVKHNKMLPAVAYLEMVRAAIVQALPQAQADFALEIAQVVWAQPIVVTSPKTIHIALAPQSQTEIDFEIYSAVVEGRPQETIHAQGQVRLIAKTLAPHIDMTELQGRMRAGKPSPKKLYQAFDQMGIQYGPAYQAISKLALGQNELLAELTLPGSLHSELADFALHPSLMDSALHASMGLSNDLETQPSEPPLPFALEAMTLFAPCQREMFSHVRFSPDSADAIVKLDIDLYDADGQLCVQMRGFTSRELGPDEKGKQGVLLAEPIWQAINTPKAQNPQTLQGVVLLASEQLSQSQLQPLLPECQIITLSIDDLAQAAIDALVAVKQAMADNLPLQVVTTGNTQLLALAALIKTARLEKPDWFGRVLDSNTLSAQTLALQLATPIEHSLVRFNGNTLQAERYQVIELGDAEPVFSPQGVYVITGGLGGLGLLFCQEIIAKAPTATVVLTGRSALSDDKKAELANLGEQVHYQQMALNDRQAVKAAIDEIVSRFGTISAVMHSAGQTHDGLLSGKTAEQAREVLEAKLSATEYLDEATKDLALEFFALFSSVSGAMGNVGQADYAMANSFMDQFAKVRNGWVNEGKRHGHSLSINWPLWRDGGMQLDAQAQTRLAQTTGAIAMQTQSGMQAFYQGIQAQCSQLLVMEGELRKMRDTLSRTEPAQASQNLATDAGDNVNITESAKVAAKAQRYLSELLAELLKMPAQEIQPDAALEDYGIDSILAMNLTHQLEQRFGSLSKTLFFEYQTLNQLAGYFAKAHGAHFAAHVAKADKPLTKAASSAPVPATLATRQGIRSIRERARFVGTEAAISKRQVAIVGLAGRFPMARDINQFWQNLQNGIDCVSEIPPERWDHNRYFSTERNIPGTSYSKWGGFIEDADKFDAQFFNISPNEARLLDPQERLFLQTAWHAIEDAGYSKAALWGRKFGVYVGVMYGQYELYGAESIQSGQNQIATSSFASIANRVSYFFNLNGPSLAVDTMCSSSLSALHLAAQGIAQGELEGAIAGGVNLTIHPHKYLNLSQGNFVASDGRCRSFGAGGDGYVPGEGVGAVMLKALNDALVDGDHIYGLVKASSLNHGGKTNGYTVPNPNAQGELILDALKQANIAPSTLGYIETHGTGTSLGDPIEITGLNRAFEGYGVQGQICPIGSVKSNIGHLESAAGIAALTKVLLQIQHGQLVPSLHAQTLNPNIDFAASAFYVQRELAEFERPTEHPRRAGISSFGAGGANAHVIIEEYVDTRAPSVPSGDPLVFVFSAANSERLKVLCAAMADYLTEQDSVNLLDLAYTLQVGRSALNERLVIVAKSSEQLITGLRAYHYGNPRLSGVYSGNVKKASNNAGSLIAGEAGAVFLKTVMASGDGDKIAQLWTAGIDIDWQLLYPQVQPKRLSLPLYPFAKERHWIDPVTAMPSAPVTASGPQLVHYIPEFKPAELSASALGKEHFSGVTWLIGEVPKGTYGIAVKAEASIESWQQSVDAQKHNLPERIIYKADKDDFYHLIYLVKALQEAKKKGALTLICLVAGDNPEQLALAALLKTICLEIPSISAKVLIDADIDALSAELNALTPTKGVEELRFSNGLREQKVLSPLKPSLNVMSGLKQQGHYLISGGLGGLGLIFAKYLAEHYQAKLLLLGRSALSDKGKQTFSELERLGAKVRYVSCDVADADAIANAVAAGVATFGALNGVIHSAGINDDSLLVHKTPEQLAKVLSAKVAGTQALDVATANQPLDLFVLFSSVAGAMGNPGQCDYAYANAFMDAYCAKRAASKAGKSLSINWPLWRDGGMQVSARDIERTERHTGLLPMPQDQGIDSFNQLLGGEVPQALALFGDSGKIAQYFAAAPTKAVQVSRSAPVKGGMANKDSLEQGCHHYLKDLVSQQTGLEVERVDASEPFESFGFDSMMINRFNAQLEADLGELPKTLLYEHESIEALAQYLITSHTPALSALLGKTLDESEVVDIVVEPEPVAVVTAEVAAVAPAPVYAPQAQVSAPLEPLSAIHDIAIIGLDGRYPQSDDLEHYWQQLAAGEEMIGTVPTSRWDAERYFDADPANAVKGKIYSKWGGFIAGFDEFDNGFFNISALDAKLMDPQERLFLQSAWAVLEDAGYTRESLKNAYPKAALLRSQSADVGVFVGVTSNTYQMLANEHSDTMLTPSAMPWSIANRVSYSLNLQGPSVPVDTACSSSLVALHMACQSIRRSECQLAIAGGVNLYLHQYKYQSLCHRQMLAKGAKTYSFGAEGDGFVASEGVGCVLLKPLAQAMSDRDHIYAVVKGSSFGHSGRANGYSVPNPTAQAQVIAEALNDAGVKAQQINYIEGHGTGTQLGDSLEVSAISLAFGRELPEQFRCPLGSVKANIGHGESAAGIAGLTKVLLQMRHAQLAPSINCEPVNPNIDFANAPVRIVRKLAKWRVKNDVMRAMINSFGAGGVNACVVLEQPPQLPILQVSEQAQLIVLSAKNEGCLRAYAERLLQFVQRNSGVRFDSLAFTLQCGREAMAERLAIVAQDSQALIAKLQSFISGDWVSDKSQGLNRGSLDPRKMRTGRVEDVPAHTLEQLAALWCEGKEMDFTQLYSAPVGRISLPSYPFEKRSHLVETTASLAAKAVSDTALSDTALSDRVQGALHPLVSYNSSTLKAVSFASRLEAKRWYGAEHQINGQALLPGAAMVEMAGIAGQLAGESRVSLMRDIVWIRPLVFNQETIEAKVHLKTIGQGTEVEVSSLDEDFEPVEHFQCQLYFIEDTGSQTAPAAFDLNSLKASAERVIDGQSLYDDYAKLGFNYGPSFRTITKLHCHKDYALAELNLNEASLAEFDQYVLHPALLDGALQAVIGLSTGNEGASGPNLPFALDELMIYRSLTPTCYVRVRRADRAAQHKGAGSRFNIEITDENGIVLAAMRHFYVRAIATQPTAKTAKL